MFRFFHRFGRELIQLIFISPCCIARMIYPFCCINSVERHFRERDWAINN